MSTAVLGESGRKGHKHRPTGFWATVKSLRAEARQVQGLSPKTLLGTLEKVPDAPAKPAALVKAVGDLERDLQQIRQQLEKALKASKAANDGPENAVEAMVASGELLESGAFAQRLGCTRQALSKALAARRVFFVEYDGVRHFPAFYADARYERRHLEALTKLLGDLPGGAKLQFFMNPRASLDKATPLQALARGQLAAVKAAAEGFVHG